jgi:hypothetical protein
MVQKRTYAQLRGARLHGRVSVPRTTTRDVLGLVAWWTDEAEKLGALELDDQDRDALDEWRAVVDLVDRRRKNLALDREYPDNAYLWRSLAAMAQHLETRAITPSTWHPPGSLAAQAIDLVDQVGDAFAKNAAKVAGAAGAAAGDAAGEAVVASIADVTAPIGATAKEVALPLGIGVAGGLAALWIARRTKTARGAAPHATPKKAKKARRRS